MRLPEHIYHYYEKASGPFKNITELGFEKAKVVQSQLTGGENRNRPANYIDLRFALEKRLKAQFIAKGGNPIRKTPLYFTLGKCDWAQSWYHDPAVIALPLSDLRTEQISFTYPDSMVSFQLYDNAKLVPYRKECNGKVFLWEELDQVVNQYGLPVGESWKSREELKYDRYIEVQLWYDP